MAVIAYTVGSIATFQNLAPTSTFRGAWDAINIHPSDSILVYDREGGLIDTAQMTGITINGNPLKAGSPVFQFLKPVPPLVN